jgi:hypothetical protein
VSVPLLELGVPSTPSPPPLASVSPPSLGPKGGEQHSFAGEGGGGPNSDDWTESLHSVYSVVPAVFFSYESNIDIRQYGTVIAGNVMKMCELWNSVDRMYSRQHQTFSTIVLNKIGGDQNIIIRRNKSFFQCCGSVSGSGAFLIPGPGSRIPDPKPIFLRAL